MTYANRTRVLRPESASQSTEDREQIPEPPRNDSRGHKGTCGQRRSTVNPAQIARDALREYATHEARAALGPSQLGTDAFWAYVEKIERRVRSERGTELALIAETVPGCNHRHLVEAIRHGLDGAAVTEAVAQDRTNDAAKAGRARSQQAWARGQANPADLSLARAKIGGIRDSLPERGDLPWDHDPVHDPVLTAHPDASDAVDAMSSSPSTRSVTTGLCSASSAVPGPRSRPGPTSRPPEKRSDDAPAERGQR